MKNILEENLMNTCRRYIPKLTIEEVKQFFELSERKEVDPNTLLKQDYSPVEEIWLVESGLIRAFTHFDNIEYTFDFFTTSFFILDIESWLNKAPCYFLYESLTPCSFFVWKIQHVNEFLDKNPAYKILLKMFVDQAFIKNNNRLVGLQTSDLTRRYLDLLRIHGDLIKDVPQYYMASYLGVKPQSLSRIKRALNNENKK